MKYAVYVEGQSEMLFVADVLQKYFDYDSQQCGILCVKLAADDYERLNHPKQGDINSTHFYQIVNVNNDNRVISKLKNDLPNLISSGFEVVIGLKDVFGKAYETIVNGSPIVDRSKIEKMHRIQLNAINPSGTDCRLHFAIMEYEAWMLGLIDNYIRSKDRSIDDISKELNIDLCSDPEKVYHPFNLVRRIYKACGNDYHKHEDDARSFLSLLAKDDYERLRNSGRCSSFSKFLDSLLGGECPELP